VSGPEPGGTPPLRLAGIALLGIAAVALIIGLLTLAGGGPKNKVVAAPPNSAPAPPPPPVRSPAPSPAPAPPPPAPAPAPAPTALPAPTAPLPGSGLPPARGAEAGGKGYSGGADYPGDGKGYAGGGKGYAGGGKADTGGGNADTGGGKADTGGGKGEAPREPVRVYNNSTIKNLAEHAAERLRASGWTVTEVGNYPYGIIPTSTVYYRPGTDEQAAAKALAERFGLRAMPRFSGIEQATPGLIVILTGDLPRR
jgi:hypothetical protein